MNTFGTRVRQARTLRGLTQGRLALASGISQSAIASYETEQRRSPNFMHVFRIAEALRVNPIWLGAGTPPMETPSRLTLREPAPHEPAMPAWPFPGVDPEVVWQLSPAQRQVLADVLTSLIDGMNDAQGGKRD